jgi:hypothetical protein
MQRKAETTNRSDQRCEAQSHRVIRLRFPYGEANVVRARLISELGADSVSPLRRGATGWVIVLCRECARDDQGGETGDD